MVFSWLKKRCTFIHIILLMGILFVLGGHLPPGIVQASSDETPTPFCRFGLNHNILNGELALVPTEPLQAGFFMDYQATPPSKPAHMEHYRMVRLKQPDRSSTDYIVSPSANTLRAIAQANPGSVWLIGNEVDRIRWQDDMMPAAYARAYHELYHLLRDADPSARIVAGNIVQVSPLRLRYLDLVLEAYRSMYGQPMPIDIWGIHTFILREKRGEWGAEIPPGVDATEGWLLEPNQNADVGIFQQQIVDFRRWMHKNGYRDNPLYVTEYGVLLGPPWIAVQDVIDFMTASFDYMLNTRDVTIGHPADNYRLVQNFSWYSVNDKLTYENNQWVGGYNGYLFEPDKGNQRSEMGDAYADYTARLQSQTDLLPVHIMVEPASLIRTTEPVTLTVNVQVANAGNTMSKRNFTLRIYNGDPDNGGTLLNDAEFAGSLAGCGQSVWISYIWRDVPSDIYTLYAEVTGDDGDVELTNNRIHQTVLFADEQIFLPFTVYQLR
jgi:hypothetical protein